LELVTVSVFCVMQWCHWIVADN